MDKTNRIIMCLILSTILLGTIGMVVAVPLNYIIGWIGQYNDEINTVALVVGGIFVLIRYNHSKKLEYTQDERRAWRNSLRYCLEYLLLFQQSDASFIDDFSLEHVRIRVKASLNPNSSAGSLDYLISKQFEGDNIDLSNQILALQVLLKYDWERAKKENSIFFSKCKKEQLDETYRDLLCSKLNPSED